MQVSTGGCTIDFTKKERKLFTDCLKVLLNHDREKKDPNLSDEDHEFLNELHDNLC